MLANVALAQELKESSFWPWIVYTAVITKYYCSAVKCEDHDNEKVIFNAMQDLSVAELTLWLAGGYTPPVQRLTPTNVLNAAQ